MAAEELKLGAPANSGVTAALAGDKTALGRLVDRLMPVVHARVARTLLRHASQAPRWNVRQVVEDLTQEVFLRLLEDDARVLRDWDPRRGLSLENFVGLVAERRVLSVLRRTRRNPWTEEPVPSATLDRPSAADPETAFSSRERLRWLLARFREELSPLGWHLFELLFIRQCSVADVKRETGLRSAAVYAWRSRLRRLARRLLRDQETGR